MTKEENHLQHRLTKEEFYNFLKKCRDKDETSLHYVSYEGFFIDYLEFRGVILPPDIAILKMNHTFTNASFMRSLDEIMEDAARYYTVFIKKFASIIDSAFKNCARPDTEFFDMSEKEVEAILSNLLKELKSERKYTNEAAFGFQWSLFVIFFILRTEMREKVGDFLVEINYNEIFNIVDKIGEVKPKDALECNDVYALTMVTLNATVYYSSISQRFALYLVNIGLLTTLTIHITEAGYQNYLYEKPLSMMANYVLVIVHNIAYHSDSKTKLKLDATKKALMNFPKFDNSLRKLLIMLSLVYIMDEHAFGLLSDESNVINKMVDFMKKALDEKNRVYVISLCQLADGLSKLTIKSSNSSKIIHKEGALSALVNMLRYKDVKENASAVRCIHALAQDSTVRSTLMDFPDLLSALVDLRKTTSVKLKKIIDDTLKTLQACTPVSGAFAEPSLIAETSKLTEDIAVRGQSLYDVINQLAVEVSQLKNASSHENQRLTQPLFKNLCDATNQLAVEVSQLKNAPLHENQRITQPLFKSIPAAKHNPAYGRSTSQNSQNCHQVVERGRSRNHSKNVKRSRSDSANAHKYVDGTSQCQNSAKHKNRSRHSMFNFINCAIKIESAHVTNLVKQEEKYTARGKSEMLKPEDEQTIKRHWKYLIEEVDATHITTALISRGVFDVDDKREILGPNSRRKRTEIMLLKLLNAGPETAYKKFIEVLEVDHSHIVDELRK